MHILNTGVVFRKPGMEGCDEEVSFEKLKTPQTQPGRQSPLWNCLNISTTSSTMPNIQSSKKAFNNKHMNVQLRIIMFFCVKAAIFVLQLFIHVCGKEEWLGPSDLPGFGPFPTWCEQVPWASRGDHRSLSLMSSSFPSEVKAGPLTPLTQQCRRTSTRELGCFSRACFTLSRSQEVEGVEEDESQVCENVKLLLCYSHKATVSLMARSDYLVSKIGSLNYAQISDYLLWVGSKKNALLH